MMLLKCCTLYASKFGKLSSSHRTGKGQFSFQSKRKAMPKNAQTTAQLHSSTTQGKVKVTQLSLTLCDPMKFSKPEYWSGYPFPSPGHFPSLGIEPGSPGLQADSLTAKLSGKP